MAKLSPVRLALGVIAVGALALSGAGAHARPPHRVPMHPPYPGQLSTVFNLVPAAPARAGTCAPPTLADCKNIHYLVSACGQANQAACQPLLRPEYEQWYNSLPVPVDRPMFPYGKPTTFSNLKVGKLIGAALAPPTTSTKPGSSQMFQQAHQQWSNSAAQLDPIKFVPHPEWEANGTVVESCEEYVAEKYYDYYRWETATSLCKGDEQCDFDVAYAGTATSGAPRIANRVLRGKDGSYLSEQPYGDVPTSKNAFFAAGSYYLGTGATLPGRTKPFKTFAELKALWPQFATDLDELRAALEDGAVFYGTQAGAGINEVYKDTWAWQSTMRTRTRNLSENEFEELARREAEMEDLLAETTGVQIPQPINANRYVPPQDLVTVMGPDPFQRLNLWRNDAQRNQRVSAHAQFMAPSATFVGGVRGALGGGGAVRFAIPESLLAKPQNPNPIAVGVGGAQSQLVSNTVPQIACPQPQVMTYQTGAQAGMSRAAVDKANQAEVGKTASCKILNHTLAEWWRRKEQKATGACNDRNSCGCLDLGAYGCDWSPKKFYDAYVKPRWMSGQRQFDLNFCQKWSFAGFANIAANDKKDTKSFEKYLTTTRDTILKIVAKIPRPDPKAAPGTFGQSIADEHVEGHTDSFSAGYKYDVGWTVKANDWYPSKDDPNRKPCSLEGNARGGFWARITTPFDGSLKESISDVWRHAVDADAWARVSEDKNHQLRYETHLIIASYELYDPVPKTFKPGKDWGYTYNKDDPKTYAAIELNHTYNASPVKSDPIESPHLSITVMAGPIPITGAVWVELRYGADIALMARTPPKCDANLTLYEASASFIPWAELDAAMTIGVGISGLAYVGVKGDLTLLKPSLPLTASTRLGLGGQDGLTMNLQFEMKGDLRLTTLAGRLALYVQFLGWDHEFELFKWAGLGPYDIHLFDVVSEKLPLFSLRAFPAQ